MTSIGAYSYSDSDFKAIYTEGKKYLINNAVSKINGTAYYDEYTYDGFDVITLNGSLESSKGYKPCKIVEIDNSYRFEKNKIFKYDEDMKKCVYASLIEYSALKKGNTASLAYKLPLEVEGTITLRFKFASANKEKCIFSAVNGSTEKLGLYVTSANSFRIVVNGSSLNVNVVFTSDVWNKLIVRYKSGSLQVYCNDTVLYNFADTIDLTDSIIYFGNDSTSTKPLNGYLEMIAYSNTFITDTVKTKLFNDGTMISVRNKMDNLGRLSENTISVNDTNYVTSYSYNKTRVLSQTLPNGDTISYEYNDVGQVIKKTYTTSSDSSEVTYTYDKLGRLIEEVYEDETKHEYTYDKSGNITYDRIYEDETVIEEIQYGYTYDKLTRISNNTNSVILQELVYGQLETDFYPTELTINDVTTNLTWNGKRLASIGGNINYTYNSQGIRIKKETPDEITTFVLEGSNIISMNKTVGTNTYRLDFVYDSSNQIIGLNTIEGNYFYIKDITGNILGLIDSTGAFVVKYKYDAWGKLLDKTIVTTCIASTHNPFVYKGYYLDEETNFYYLNARYYAPEWRRFISPDNFDYLQPESITGLNLYAYCMNDPINFADPSGHMPKWAQWVVGGLAIAGLVVATVLTCGVAGAGAAAVGAAMLTGGLVSAGINVADQLSDGGEFNWTELAISALSGTAYGLVVGLTGGAGGWAVAGKFAVAGGTSLLNSWNENATFGETMKSLGISLLVSGAAQGAGYLAGKFGPQIISKIFPRNPNHLLTIGDIGSALWAIPAVKTGAIRLAGGIVGSIFNNF